MIPCVTGGEKPQEVTTLKEVEGVNVNCDLDREDIDLSSFTPQARDEIIALLDGEKGKRHPATVFIKERLEHTGMHLMARCLTWFIVLAGSFSAHAMSSTANKITWQYEYCKDGVVITGSTVPKDISEIIVPDKLGGSNVVEIGVSAVSSQYRQLASTGYVVLDESPVNSLRIPNKIKRIRAKAFYERIIRCVEMPESLEVIDRHAFGCHVPAGAYSSGAYHPAGETPSTVSQIIFWGKKPRITNELHLNYLNTYLPSGKTDGDIMFYGNGVEYTHVVAVGDAYIGLCSDAHPEMFGDSSVTTAGEVNFKFQHATLRPAYANVIVSCQRMSDMEVGTVVTLSTVNNTAKIYYTIDGSEPKTEETENCFLYKEPILVRERTLIKAVAKVNSSKSVTWQESWSGSSPTYRFNYYSYNKVETLDCLECAVLNPIVQSTKGDIFDRAGNVVSLSCPDDAVIRYTLDGSPVSESSPVYTSAFTISDTTTVRVRAYKDKWFPSEEVVQTFTRVWYTNEPPVISAESAAFDTASQEVAISCATEGATVYYTIDGSEPSAANGRVYKGPFRIYDSVTVKAIAVKDDWKESVVASAAFTKKNGLSAAINMYDYLPDNDADAPWTVDADVSHDGVKSVRSGAIGEDGVTTMKVTVRGAGKLTFWWKSECEEWDEDYYDYGAFRVGNETEPRFRIAGMTDWKREEVVFDTTGKHICKWEYHKDDAESIPRDCIWVDQVQWMPSDGGGRTLTTEVAVPYAWLDRYGLGDDADFETAASQPSAKEGIGFVWQEYLLGLDPTNADDKVGIAAPQSDDPDKIALGLADGHTDGSGYVAVVKVEKDGKVVSEDGLIDLSGEGDPTGLYMVAVSLVREGDAAKVAEVAVAQTVGVLKGESTMTKTAISVPWGRLNGGGPVSVAELVKTANLTVGDKLHVYDRDGRKYRTWQLDGAHHWQPLATYVIAEDGSVSSESAGAPSDTTVKRGSAVWLERQDPTKPYYLFGGADGSDVTADIACGSKDSPVWNLIASPSLEPFDVKTVEGADANDQIVVPTAEGPKVYTFKDGAWGADVNVTETRTMPDGTKVEVVKRGRDTVNTTIPAGVGFWYVSQGGKPVIRW